jgi:16S rRNA U1498 N3-methylase RsmE
MGEQERYFEMVVVTELIEQELAALRHWIDLRKEAVEQCRNYPNPPADVLKRIQVTGDEVLRRLGQINRLVTAREATFARPAGVTGFDRVLSAVGAELKRSTVRTSR